MAVRTPDDWCDSPGETPAPLPRIDRNTLCDRGWTRLLLTGFLRDWMTRHFQRGNIQAKDLRNFVWTPQDNSEIQIESIYRWRGATAGKRPAIVIKPGTMTNRRLGIGDQRGPNEQGQLEFSTYWVGSHTLFCISGSGAGAEILGAEVQQELTGFAYVVIAQLKLKQFKTVEVGEPQELEEYKENFVVPVTVGWTFEWNWKVSRESMRLARVPFSVILDGHANG